MHIDGTASSMKRYPPSGLSVLIVGGGIAGLSFAIEAHRKGHSVRIIEKRPESQDFGDVIVLQSCALRTPRRSWPGFAARLQAVCYEPRMHVKKYDGTPVGSFPYGLADGPGMATSRSALHAVLHGYAQELGLRVEFGTGAADYFETDDGVGGVVLADGAEIEADVVVAADGVGSRAWRLVTGRREEPTSSGFAIYRASYPLEAALKNPVVAEGLQGAGNQVAVYMGPDTHSVIGTNAAEVFWTVTHKDDGHAAEDWTKAAPVSKALQHVAPGAGWHAFLAELIRTTPAATCTDWKLLWRDPQPQWTSPGGRVVQIGDAAHAFLPTSAAGATMGVEDAVSLAACLQLAGATQNVPHAVRAHNLMRFGRVSCAQKLGFKNREAFHKTDWVAAERDPTSLGRTAGAWQFAHDPERYAYGRYGDAVDHLVAGTPFENTNAVPGYSYRPWTVRELLDASERGEVKIDEGEWY